MMVPSGILSPSGGSTWSAALNTSWLRLGKPRGGADHVVVFGLLGDARRAASHQYQHLLQFFRDRCDGQAIAGADIAEHDVDIVALVEVAQLLHLLGGAAILVDDDGLDLHAAEPDLFVRRGRGALVQLVDDELTAVAGGDAKTVGGRPGQECHDPELEGILRRTGRGTYKRYRCS